MSAGNQSPGIGIAKDQYILHHLFCLSAFNNQAVFVVQAIGINQCCFVIFVEELFLAKGFDFLIQPVQKRAVPLETAGAILS